MFDFTKMIPLILITSNIGYTMLFKVILSFIFIASNLYIRQQITESIKQYKQNSSSVLLSNKNDKE